MKRTALILTLMSIINLIYGQDIFKEYGLKEPLTLSRGRYSETFPNKETVQIGTVLLNTGTNKIVEFLEEDTTEYAYQAEYSTRWLSPDPLAEKYPQLSPYVYCANNPLKYIDPDGREFDGYLMDKRGYISLIPVNNEGGDQYDVIYNQNDYIAGKRDYDETGNKSGIQINKGEVQNAEYGKPIKIMSEGYFSHTRREDKYEVTSDSKAQSIMNFVEKNTAVEAGNTYAEKANGEKVNLILTSHESGTVRNSSVSNLEKYLGAGHTVIRDDHIHPRQYSGDNSNPSGSDEKRATTILQYSPNAQFRILNNGIYYPYNQYGKIKK